ncbi:MAG: hypothetical protein M8467_04035 [Anaerolineae bacterium]|nr:hypothetical protein [Anaerolineae bacterium]
MRRKSLILAFGLVLLLAVLTIGGAALAQTSSNYNLEWHVIGGGGRPVSSARYVVHSTIGQGSASLFYLTGEHHRLAAGFWAVAGVSGPYRIYLPIVMRNAP